MPEVLLAVIVALVVMFVFVAMCAAVAVAVVVAVARLLAVRNRLVPGQRSPAPLSWLASPAAAARLHRRLRTAMAGAHLSTAGPRAAGLGLADLVGEVRNRALDLDAQLVLASRMPRPARLRMLRELHSEVLEVEQLAGRLVHLSRLPAEAGTGSGLAAVRQRLELLEEALAELDGVQVRLSPARPVPLRRQG